MTGFHRFFLFYRIWPTVYYSSNDAHSQNVPNFFNLSVCAPIATSNQHCSGDHVCYTADFVSFYSLGQCLVVNFVSIFGVFFVASHGSCVYKSENRMLTLSFDFSSAAAFQFGGGNVTITLVCGMSLVSSNLHCICNNCYLHVPY